VRSKVIVGIDVGTSGVRGVAASTVGELLVEAQHILASDHQALGGVHEQDPNEWWEALCQLCRRIVKSLESRGALVEIGGIAVASTSGSLVLTDASGNPLRRAILYDDARGAEIADKLNRLVDDTVIRLNPSYSIVKAAWVREAEPAVWDQTRYILHPTDWLTGKLTGDFGLADFSNVLKLGYDPEKGTWNDVVDAAGLPRDRLPKVRRPGEQIGVISAEAAAATGLSSRIPVMAGATDGVSGLIASGANQIKHANTTLGTTIVWKALSRTKPAPGGGIYCHLHPDRLWVPGAASNTGPGSLRTEDHELDTREMDRLAAQHIPTPILCYLLSSQGERFPFSNPRAESFVEGSPRGSGEWHAAQLQSLGFVERWGYEILESHGVEIGDVIFSTGGAARSPILSQLRSNILKRTVVRSRHPSAGFGAAILAASGTVFAGNVRAAIHSMTALAEEYTPSPMLVRDFDDIYGKFRTACAKRGFIA
jgi:sugar (pentulose or hexulose) kinase